MRSACYILAVIVLLIAGLAAALALYPRESRSADRQQIRVVYVDTNRLTELHPGSAVLVQMRQLLKSTSASAAMPHNKAVRSQSNTNRGSRLGHVIELPTVSRDEIEEEITRSAANALALMEADEMQALRARLTATRATMMENARSGVAAQVRAIDQTAATEQRSLVAELGDKHLAAQLRSDALRASLNLLSTAADGTASASNGGYLEILQSQSRAADDELKQFSDALSSRRLEITGDAREQETKIRAAAAAKIGAEIAAVEGLERARIERAIANARDAVFDELNSPSFGPDLSRIASASATGTTVTVTPRPQTMPVSKSDAAALQRHISSIENKIRLDVTRAVKLVAADEQVRVVFAPRAATPDATALFAAKLKARGMSVWSPVLATGVGPSKAASVRKSG